jgi:hypothetical protein
MEEEGNPNEPIKAMAPGLEGAQRGDREKEKERQRETERVEATYGGAGYNRVEGSAEPGTRRPFISSGKGWNAPNQALRYIDESDKTLDPNYVAALKRGEYATRTNYARAFPREFINHPELKSAPQDVQDLVAAARGGTVLGRQ